MQGKVGLPEIRELMKRYLEQDSGKNSIEAEGTTPDEALTNASVQLGIPKARLEFEVLDSGSQGLFGVGRKPCRIRAYEVVKKEKIEAVIGAGKEAESVISAEPEIADKDGEVFVRLSGDGALLKVVAPIGRGKRISEKQAVDRLHARAVRNFDQDLVMLVVKEAAGEYMRIGEFITNPANDAMLTVDIADQEMKALIVIMPPGPGGCDLAADTMVGLLRNGRVIHGVLEDRIRELEDKPIYKEPILVAEGTKPANGKDSYVVYNFEIDQSKVRLKETTGGKVNFKELNLIQNVVAGQPLARKIPPEKGIPGKTVTGKLIPAKNGKDIPLPLGKNVHVADDGVTMISDINGQVMLISNKINVEEILTVQGDVSLRTGNIMFLGTVIVAGNVEDGYYVKASGNIEVSGSVGKAELDAEGDIIVHQGVAGKSGGRIHAGKSLWSRFIENAVVEAGEYVVVSDGIINSQVDANKKIICQGKRAAIVGGKVRASEEINAKILGSAVGGAETIIEVGYDPKSKERQQQLIVKLEQIKRPLEELDKNIYMLSHLKRQRKQLSPEKEASLRDQIEKKADLLREMAEISREIETITAYLNQLKVRGKISASGKVYPGVRMTIKDISSEVKTEQKGVTFYLENNMIRTTRYEEVEDIDVRRGPPDAFKTN